MIQLTMVIINKVTTKTGDSGKTLGPGRKQIYKKDVVIDFLGTLDELNVIIGEVYYFQTNEEIKIILLKIQHQLFEVGAMFYKQQDLDQKNIEFLEKNIEKTTKNNQKTTSFLIPNGTLDILKLHLARTTARKCERYFFKTETSFHNIGKYLNRLSDLLFLFINLSNNKEWSALA